jgi:hypothetical protein
MKIDVNLYTREPSEYAVQFGVTEDVIRQSTDWTLIESLLNQNLNVLVTVINLNNELVVYDSEA